jgi:hypothetical protein
MTEILQEAFILNKQNDHISDLSLEQNEQVEHSAKTVKKLFIEPRVSVPVDVLEATTNFLFLTADAAQIS